MIKSLIRRLELHERIYVQGARDVFLALLLHGTTARVGSRVSISEFVYHYVLLPGEPPLDGHANVWPCIVRPSVNPTLHAFLGFETRFASAQRRAMSWPCGSFPADASAVFSIAGRTARTKMQGSGGTWP